MVTDQGVGTYSFRLHADYGLGAYLGVDGATHTPGNIFGHVVTSPAALTAGDHEFEILGFEDWSVPTISRRYHTHPQLN